MGMHSWRHLDKIDKNWNLLTKLIRIVLVSSTYIELFTVFHVFSCLVEIMYQTWYHNLNSHYTIPTLSHIGKNSKTTCLEATVNSGCSTLWQWNPYIYIYIYIHIVFGISLFEIWIKSCWHTPFMSDSLSTISMTTSVIGVAHRKWLLKRIKKKHHYPATPSHHNHLNYSKSGLL